MAVLRKNVNINSTTRAGQMPGSLGPMSLGAAAMRLGAKMGLGTDTAAAQKNQAAGDAAYADAMREITGKGAKANGKTVSKVRGTGTAARAQYPRGGKARGTATGANGTGRAAAAAKPNRKVAVRTPKSKPRTTTVASR